MPRRVTFQSTGKKSCTTFKTPVDVGVIRESQIALHTGRYARQEGRLIYTTIFNNWRSPSLSPAKVLAIEAWRRNVAVSSGSRLQSNSTYSLEALSTLQSTLDEQSDSSDSGNASHGSSISDIDKNVRPKRTSVKKALDTNLHSHSSPFLSRREGTKHVLTDGFKPTQNDVNNQQARRRTFTPVWVPRQIRRDIKLPQKLYRCEPVGPTTTRPAGSPQRPSTSRRYRLVIPGNQPLHTPLLARNSAYNMDAALARHRFLQQAEKTDDNKTNDIEDNVNFPVLENVKNILQTKSNTAITFQASS